MITRISELRLWILPLLLAAGSCTNDPGDGEKQPTGTQSSSGNFKVSLIEPTETSQGYSSILGRVFDGPSPSPILWKEAASSGSCRLYTPKAPFCETPCGSQATCVENNVCQAYPKSVGVGKVTVNGVKTKAGAASFSMDPVLNGYQPTAGVVLDFPPFAEGDAVTLSAKGDTAVPAFTVSVSGISPLALLNDSVNLADGKPIKLLWTPPKTAGASVVTVLIDISHHGGSKGKIECEGPDTGSMDVAANLVDQLRALGVSGFPRIDVARKATGTNAAVHVDLVLESMVTKFLSIPGLISCNDTDDCPGELTCQKDLQCK